MTNERLVIVGGGLAGLSAAICAAQDGRRVELVERVSQPGGRARTRNERGFLFNMGPHALYKRGVGMEVLEQIGVTPNGGEAPLSGAQAGFGGALHALPGGFVSLLTSSLLGLPEKLETGRLLAGIARMDTSKYDRVTIREALDRELKHERTRQLAEALFRLTSYTHAPDLASGGAALEQLKHSLGGVLYLHGGWQSLVDDLRESARRAGVTLRCGTAVEAVTRDVSGRVDGVTLAGGERLAASAVIVAAGPREACGLVDAGRDTLLTQWAERATPVCMSTLDVGLSSWPQPKLRFVLGIDEPTYFSVHSETAELAPRGAVVLHMSQYLPAGEKLERDVVRRGLEAKLDQLQPGWREVQVTSKFLHQLTVTNAVVRADDGGLGGRPGPAVAHVPGLFVAGDWVGAEGQLADASLASGREAARLARGHGAE